MNEPVDPTTPIPITLQAQEWNQVLSLLSEAPFKLVAPLVNQISAQAQHSIATRQGTLPLSNGDDLRGGRPHAA